MIFNKSYFFKVMRMSLLLFTFVFVFFYFFTSKADAAPVFTIDAPVEATVGDENIIVEVSGNAVTGDYVASFSLDVNWNPEVLEYQSYSVNLTDTGANLTSWNLSQTGAGKIILFFETTTLTSDLFIPITLNDVFVTLTFDVIGPEDDSSIYFENKDVTVIPGGDPEIPAIQIGEDCTFTDDTITLNSVAGQLTISDPTLTTDKVYDGTNTASVTAGELTGLLEGDDVTVSAVATYDNANVGTEKTITVVYTLGGDDAGNYIKPVNYVVNTGVITAISLDISDPTLTTDKVYDGTTTASVEAGTLTGVLPEENVTVSAVATYDNANVGTGKTITVVYTLGGADAGNYIKPVNYVVNTGVITVAPITIQAIPGITPPVTGAPPVSTITPTAQYTGTVSWSPDHDPFQSEQVYTATITLTANSNYTLTGVTEDFFTVTGSTSATNEANSGEVIAVFPATAVITAPVLGSSSTSSISKTSATLNGNITSTGGAVVTARGFHYGLDTEYGQQVVANGSFGNGAYSLGVSGLTCATTYPYRSFATNSVGTTEGNIATFTTSNCSTGGGSSGSYLPSYNPFITPPYIPPVTPPVYPPTPPTVVIPIASINRNLKLDMVGEDVKALQIFLNNNGYVLATVGNGSPGNETDFFGPITKEAVMKFQIDNDLEADGIVGPATIDKMKESAEPAFPLTTTFTRNLKLDMVGEDVKALQIFLNNNGYVLATIGNGSPGNETDFFGEITKQAVMKFQIAKGLTADGIVGPATVNKMK